jgi:hypothetical protein
MTREHKQPKVDKPFEYPETRPTRNTSPAKRRSLGEIAWKTLTVGTTGVGVGLVLFNATHNQMYTQQAAPDKQETEISTDITPKQQAELQWIQAHLDSKAADVPDITDPQAIDWHPVGEVPISVTLQAGDEMNQAAIDQYKVVTGHNAPQTVIDSITVASNNLVEHLRANGEETHPQVHSTFQVQDLMLEGQERAVIINFTNPKS